MSKSVRLNFDSRENLLEDSQLDKAMEDDEEMDDPTFAGPSGKRKSNFSNAEILFLVEQYKEHKHDMEGLVELTGSRMEKSEAWEEIHRKYIERWPDKGRSVRDLRRKLSKLRSETRYIYKKEKLRRQGTSSAGGAGASDEIPNYIWNRSIQKSHKIMLSALQSDFEDSDPEAEYVEYELEFDDQDVAGADEDNADDGGGDDDDASDPERIFQKLLRSKSTPRTRSKSMAQRKSREDSGPATRKRKRDSLGRTKELRGKGPKTKDPQKTTEEEILDLKKANLEIEQDNLLLAQRKLQLEVAILEKQLRDTSGGSGGGGSGSNEGRSSRSDSGSGSSSKQGDVGEVIGTDGATEAVAVADDE